MAGATGTGRSGPAPGPQSPTWRSVAIVVLVGVGASAGALQTPTGPGDPTTPYLSGFGNSCRLAFDGGGNLFVNDGGVFYRVAPGESPTLFTDQVPGARGFAFDAFGNLLVASPQDTAIYRVTPSAEVSRFTTVDDARAVAVGPDGSVWASAVDTIYHFDAVGRHLDTIDLTAAGAAAFGTNFSPQGELHFSSFAGLWKISGGAVVPVLTAQPLRNRGFAIDADGNIYWARDADTGDTDRIIYYDAAGQVLEDTMIADVVDPCLVLFVRGTDGATTNRLLIAQVGGTIVEANAPGIPTGGVPAPPLSIGDIAESDCADEAAGAGEPLSDDDVRFLDAIGNNNGGYDVGDFRAYLLATGAIQALGGGS